MSKAFIKRPICSLKPGMNKSVSLFIVSSKSSSKSPPSFTFNKILVNVSFKERALIPVPFESIKSKAQFISRHSLLVYWKDLLLLKGNCKYAINLLFCKLVLN